MVIPFSFRRDSGTAHCPEKGQEGDAPQVSLRRRRGKGYFRPSETGFEINFLSGDIGRKIDRKISLRSGIFFLISLRFNGLMHRQHKSWYERGP
ncbi:hypothetical protein V6L77_08700 [Pannonibacter sp. Pt2-lr]